MRAGRRGGPGAETTGTARRAWPVGHERATAGWARRALAEGRHVEAATELAGWVAEQPTAEGLVPQLMLALYRSGQAGDALTAYAASSRSRGGPTRRAVGACRPRRWWARGRAAAGRWRPAVTIGHAFRSTIVDARLGRAPGL
ncbi:BTAD domain-containing putative transcriptional regulator [Micromonospora sp. DT178]|uniref:BTAD domain-containing putative transcriptional regulator n=1 Tax=Micromonospora sp. DT178 TaxID=3393436 RepID=UPI003CF1B16B